MPLHYNKPQFKAKIIDPYIVRTVKSRFAELKRGAKQYANGASKELQRKDHVRAVIVLPLTMPLSLFFGLINGSLLLFTLATIIMPKQVKKQWRARITAIAMVIIVFMPFLSGNKISRSDTFDFMITKAKAEMGGLAWPFEWVIRTQPLIYPVGAAIKNPSTR